MINKFGTEKKLINEQGNAGIVLDWFLPEKNEVNHYEGRECREERGFYKVQRMAGNCILTLGFLTVEIVLLLLLKVHHSNKPAVFIFMSSRPIMQLNSYFLIIFKWFFGLGFCWGWVLVFVLIIKRESAAVPENIRDLLMVKNRINGKVTAFISQPPQNICNPLQISKLGWESWGSL